MKHGSDVLRADRTREACHVGLACAALALVPIVTMLVQPLLHAVVLAILPSAKDSVLYWWSIGSLPMYTVAMPCAYAVFRLCPAAAPERRRRLSVGAFFGVVALAMTLSLVGGFFANGLEKVLPFLPDRVTDSAVSLKAEQTPLWMLLLFSVLLAPLFEEWTYRKLLVDRLTRYGTLPAILSSGVVFGLIHGNLQQLCSTLPVGVLLAYVYLYTGRWELSVLLHALLNLLGGVLPIVLQRIAVAYPATASALPTAYGTFLLFCAVAAFPTVGWLWRTRERMPATVRLSPKAGLFVVVCNPGVWLLLGGLGLLFFL